MMDSEHEKALVYAWMLYTVKAHLLVLQGLLFALYADTANNVDYDDITKDLFTSADTGQITPLILYMLVEAWHMGHMLFAHLVDKRHTNRIRALWSVSGKQTNTQRVCCSNAKLLSQRMAKAAYRTQPVCFFWAAALVCAFWSGSFDFSDGFTWLPVALLVMIPVEFGLASVVITTVDALTTKTGVINAPENNTKPISYTDLA